MTDMATYGNYATTSMATSTSTYLYNHVIMLNDPDFLLASTCFSGTRGLVGGHM